MQPSEATKCCAKREWPQCRTASQHLYLVARIRFGPPSPCSRTRIHPILPPNTTIRHPVHADPPPRVTPRAFARLAEINAANGSASALRVAVEGGGCSGFQYEIKLDDPAPDDVVLEGATESGVQKVLIDAVSLPFLQNAVIDYSEELIGARFVVENPNATSSCGCGTSFSM